MKTIFLVAGVIFIANTAAFASASVDRKDRKEEKVERREARKELRKERRAENRTEVSYLTKNNFSRDFGAASNVRFAKSKEFDEVFFMSGKKHLKAYYDYNSDLVGTTQNISFADIPANAQKEIRKHYPGYVIGGVVKFDDNEANSTDMILFSTPFQDADNYFVEMKKANKATILKVNKQGEVSFFKSVK